MLSPSRSLFSRLWFSRLWPGSPSISSWLRIVPTSITRDELVRLRRTPGMRFVFIDGSHVPKDRAYYPPGRLDRVLAYKESPVPPPSITQAPPSGPPPLTTPLVPAPF